MSHLGEVPDTKKEEDVPPSSKDHLILKQCGQLPFKVPGRTTRQEGLSEVTRTFCSQIRCPALPVQHHPVFIYAREQLEITDDCSRPVSFSVNESIQNFIIVLVAT